MKFIVDANVSPRLAVLLGEAGHDAVAVRDIGLGNASDDEILDFAIAQERVVISHDTDFGTLLAFRNLRRPSFILVRSSDPLTPDEHAELILSNLDAISTDLVTGAIVVFSRGRLRVRQLPVR